MAAHAIPLRPASMSRLQEAIAQARPGYETAIRRQEEAREAISKAESAVEDAKKAHGDLQAAAIAGKDVTAESLGIALHTITGAESLVDVRRAALVAREADVTKALEPLQWAMQAAVTARAKRMRDDVDNMMAEAHALREKAVKKGELTMIAERQMGTISIRRSARGGYSAESVMLDDVTAAELENELTR